VSNDSTISLVATSTVGTAQPAFEDTWSAETSKPGVPDATATRTGVWSNEGATESST